MRIAWDDLWLDFCQLIAQRGTCPRKHVGAVLIDTEQRIVSHGYNGAPKGRPHCCDAGCHIDERGRCLRANHAEFNAFLYAAKAGRKTDGSTLYCNVEPCWTCTKAAVAAGVTRIVYEEEYRGECLGYLDATGVDWVTVEWRHDRK